VTLLTNQTYAKNPSKWQSETILAEREEAPTRGVLVPEYNYRTYQKALERWDKIDPIEKKLLLERPVEVKVNYTYTFAAFTLGIGIGVLAAMLVAPRIGR